MNYFAWLLNTSATISLHSKVKTFRKNFKRFVVHSISHLNHDTFVQVIVSSNKDNQYFGYNISQTSFGYLNKACSIAKQPSDWALESSVTWTCGMRNSDSSALWEISPGRNWISAYSATSTRRCDQILYHNGYET